MPAPSRARPAILGLRMPPDTYTVARRRKHGTAVAAFGDTLYRAVPDAVGGCHVTRTGQPADTDDAEVRLLLDYLTGPRNVLLSVWDLRAGTSNATPVTEHAVTVANGPWPQDLPAWNTWALGYGATWLTAHHPFPGLFAVTAQDLGAREEGGVRGLWNLASCPIDVRIDAPGTNDPRPLPASRPACSDHGPMQLHPAHPDATPHAVGSWYGCPARDCWSAALLPSRIA
ncbi:hypothetical protein ACFV3E_40835 [Streptomyces sp. NPDC059718]